jgi:hypothetical protein
MQELKSKNDHLVFKSKAISTMKIELTLLFFLISIQSVCGQECNFQPQNFSNQLLGKATEIAKSTYDKVPENAEKYIEFTPVSELEIIKKHPKLFKFKDSCYRFKARMNNGIGIKTPELSACKYLNEEKEYSNYELKGIYSNHVLIEVTKFEYWGFLSVDLKTGITFFTMGKPLTSHGETAISFSNYYLDEEIAFTDLKTKKQYIVGIDGWRTIESKSYKNTYYLKLIATSTKDCEEKIKYLKVEVKN